MCSPQQDAPLRISSKSRASPRGAVADPPRAMRTARGLRGQLLVDIETAQRREAGTFVLPLPPDYGAEPSSGPSAEIAQYRWGLARAEVAPPPVKLNSSNITIAANAAHVSGATMVWNVGGAKGAPSGMWAGAFTTRRRPQTTEPRFVRRAGALVWGFRCQAPDGGQCRSSGIAVDSDLPQRPLRSDG